MMNNDSGGKETWHAVECTTSINTIDFTLCSDGDMVIRKWNHKKDVIMQEKVIKVGKTYMAAYQKLMIAINEMEN